MGLDDFMDIDTEEQSDETAESLDGDITLTQFKEYVDSFMSTSSDSAKHRLVREIQHDRNAISILAGQRFDDNGVGQTTALKAFCQAYNLDREHIEDVVSDEGSLTEAINIMEYRSGDNDSLADLYEDCLVVSEKSGNAKTSYIATMYKEYTLPSMVSFALLDDLPTGLSEKSIANAVAEGNHSKQDIVKARALFPDAIDFIEAVEEGELPSEPQVGKAFNPMLADSDSPEGDMSEWIAQYKIDGYRLLIHVSDGEAKAFTRNLKDVTDSLPELDNIDWPDKDLIYDSEVIADDGTYKTTSRRVGSKHQTVGTMNFALFDLVYMDGDLSSEPIEQRLKLLEQMTPDSERTLAIPTGDVDAIKRKALELEFEGIILKRKGSQYEYGKRSKNWRKKKFTRENLDFVMAEFIRQQGEETDTLGAIRLETKDGVSVGKVGTGWDDSEAKQLWEEKPVGDIVEISFEGIDDNLRFPVYERRKPFGDADTLERVKEVIN